MNNIAFLNINNIINKEEILIFNNKFNSNVWDFNDYFNNKATASVVLHFNFSHNNINLIDKKELLEEIKTVLYNRFKSGLKIRTNISYFLSLKPFIAFMFDIGKFDLSELNYSDFENYKNKSKRRQDLNVLNGLFKYRSNTPKSISFKPYEENIKKLFKTETNQTEIMEEKDWKRICVFAEKNINNFLKKQKKEKEYNIFLNEYYKKNNNFDFIRFDFKNKYKKSIVIIKKQREEVLYCAGILIQAFTGMRLSELLSLKRNCFIKEKIFINDEETFICKIKGKTFKYKNSNGDLEEEGVETTWYCPEFIENVISSLEIINDIYYKVHDCEDLFINPNYISKIAYTRKLNEKYNIILKKNKIFEGYINTHMFRRTLARFFAKSVLDIPVEALKEQYKHFDKSITHYYMKDAETADNSFIELMEDYSKEIINGNIEKGKELSLFIKRNIKTAIITAKNLNELNNIIDNKRIEVVNEYMISLNKENGKLSPIECLSCEGNLILPELHIDYWRELKLLYEELISAEPNSFWHKKEYLQIAEVVLKLENNEAYISKGN